jgi:hypothetical protein
MDGGTQYPIAQPAEAVTQNRVAWWRQPLRRSRLASISPGFASAAGYFAGPCTVATASPSIYLEVSSGAQVMLAWSGCCGVQVAAGAVGDGMQPPTSGGKYGIFGGKTRGESPPPPGAQCRLPCPLPRRWVEQAVIGDAESWKYFIELPNGGNNLPLVYTALGVLCILLRQLGLPLRGMWALTSSELPWAVPDRPT